MIEIIDRNLLDEVSEKAASSDRLRMNHNFHQSLEAPSQRLLNALEPGTMIPVHRHQHAEETMVLLRGKIAVLFYDDDGQLSERLVLDPISGNYGVNIPVGQWHGVEVLEKGSVIFEAKDGPYRPVGEEDILGTE